MTTEMERYNDAKAHIFRDVPPWRKADPLTHCGREPGSVTGEVLPVAEASARWKREGAMRAAYTFCMTCINRAQTYRGSWARWEDNPLHLLGRDDHGPHAELAKRELHALAALVAAHPEEWEALLAAGNDLADRRAARQQRRRR